ncbi:hypothetical protein AgCh_034885 [Apium graveolens]
MTASMQMMHLTLARLLQGFDLNTPTNEPIDMTEAPGIDAAFRILADIVDKFGPVFRIQLGLHNALVVSSKEAVMQMFTTNDTTFLSRPKSLALQYMGYNGALFALAPYGPLWLKMRKTSTSHLLSKSRLDLFKPVRAMEVTTCIKELYSVCRKNGIVGSVKFDMTTWFQQVIINMMIQMIASKRYSSFSEGPMEMESRRFRKAFDVFFALVGAFDLSKCESDGETYGCKSVDVIKELFIVFAGADATSWALALLLKHKKVLQRAQQEIDIHVGKERCVVESDIRHLGSSIRERGEDPERNRVIIDARRRARTPGGVVASPVTLHSSKSQENPLPITHPVVPLLPFPIHCSEKMATRKSKTSVSGTIQPTVVPPRDGEMEEIEEEPPISRASSQLQPGDERA